MHHCTCSADAEPVCPRCGGTRPSRDPVGVATEGVASMGLAAAGDHVTHEAPPIAEADGGDEESERDEVECLQRLHSTSEITMTTRHHRHHHQQHRSYSLLQDAPSDVGGVSARSAPDSAVPRTRQPEVSQGHGGGAGQRSRFQRFFEPLKRSRSTGNHKDAISAAQASLADPTRQQLPVCILSI